MTDTMQPEPFAEFGRAFRKLCYVFADKIERSAPRWLVYDGKRWHGPMAEPHNPRDGLPSNWSIWRIP